MKLSNKLAYIITAICGIVYLAVLAASTGIYDANDGLAHFVIAHYAPKHPELFLDHWGKPLFSTLASPFTAFGIKGVVVFNVLLYLFTSLLIIDILSKIKVRFTWAAPLLLAAMPVYFQVVMSGLTEVLFGTLVVAGLWAYVRNKFILSALLVSWLPFARSEAYFLVPLFAVFYLYRKQWWAVLLLGVAPLIMSTIGYFLLGDFWWMINNNPYTGARDIYGNGSLPHFVLHLNNIAGLGISALWILSFFTLYRAAKGHKTMRNQVFLFAQMGILLILIAHSIFWAFGLFGSLGLLRVMATVAPLLVLAVLIALEKLACKMVRGNLLQPVAFAVGVLTVGALFAFQDVVKRPDSQESTIQNLAAWYEKSPYAGNPNVWYMHPAIGYYLHIDNFEPLDSRQFWYLNPVIPSNSIREGGLIVWDNARGPSEGRTSLEKLQADPHLVEIKKFSYGETHFPDYFEVVVFEKKTEINADTLIYEDFSANRPLLRTLMNRLATDSATGQNYFDLLAITSYYTTYQFWVADSAVWQAPKYYFSYRASAPLEAFLVSDFGDSSHFQPLHDSTFSIPKPYSKALIYSLLLHNPNEEKAIRLYEFGLKRVMAEEDSILAN